MFCCYFALLLISCLNVGKKLFKALKIETVHNLHIILFKSSCFVNYSVPVHICSLGTVVFISDTDVVFLKAGMMYPAWPISLGTALFFS